MKLCIDFCILGIALIGAKQNLKKRNQFVFLILIFYMIGDVIASFSAVPAGVAYALGHVLLIHCCINTCTIKKWQYVLVIISMIGVIPFLQYGVYMLPWFTVLLSLVFYLYWLLLTLKFTLALENRFFKFAAICFMLGDCFGVARITFFPQLSTVIDYTAYVTAVLLYGLSTYNCSRKKVVCFYDVAVLNRALAKTGEKYLIGGEWSENLFLHRFLHQSAEIKILYNIKHAETLFDALNSLQYRVQSDTSAENKTLYSEKLGYLQIVGVEIMPDNSIIYRNRNGQSYILDPGFVHTLKRGNATYPCLFPMDENDSVLKYFQEE